MAEVQTEKQKRLAQELIENTQRANPKNATKLLEDAGYSPRTAIGSQKRTINAPGVQKDITPVVEAMKEARDRAITLLATKEGKAGYSDLTGGIDKLTKNFELLSGNATDRQETFLTEEQLDEIIKRRTKEDSSGR